MDTNLPMKLDNEYALMENRRNRERMKDNFKRIGRIGRDILIAGGGVIISVAGTAIAIPVVGPAVAAIGFGTYVTALTRAAYYTIHKKDDDMMFVLRRKINGDRGIYQDTLDLKTASLMRGYEPSEKAALMGLQNLLGLQRYKQEMMDRDVQQELSKDGTSYVYDKVFSTVTHGVNIKTFQALEALGYIQIESIKDKKAKLLLVERLGFGQIKEAKESIKAFLTNNQEEKKRYMRQTQEIRFKLTDKPLDLNKLYENYLEMGQKASKDLRRIGIIIRALKEKNVDIEVDELGIPRLNYKAQTSLAKRIEQGIKIKQSTERFKEGLQEFEEPSHQQDKERKTEKDSKDNDREIGD